MRPCFFFRRRLLSFAAAGILLMPAVSAYVPMRWGNSGYRLFWPSSKFPISLKVSDSTVKGTANLSSGSEPMAAIRASMQAWQSVQTASIRFSDLGVTPIQSAGEDATNLITMSDTPVNRQLIGDADGPVALTRVVFNVSNGRISEADIILNPGNKFSTTLAPGTYDLQSIVTHELGHLLGCDHAVAQNDTMFFLTGTGEFFQRYLSADSISFATFTYPEMSRSSSLGRISGKVTQAGRPVFGASVAAVDVERNVIYTTLTEPDGSYQITGPREGSYTVYAEPLDGPATVDDLLMQGSNAYYTKLNTTFRTVLKEVHVASLEAKSSPEEAAANIDLVTPDKTATLNIDRMGEGDPATGAGYLATGAVVVHPGDLLTLLIGGAGVSKVAGLPDIRILGTGITIDPDRPLKVLKNASGAEVGVSVLIHVAPDADPGARTVLVKAGDEQATSTGGIIVTQRTPPALTLYMPYMVTTPEQYTGIAIANPATLPAAVRVTSRDYDGQLIYDQDALVPSDLSIAANAQTAKLERQIFNLPPLSRQAGSIVLESDTADLQGFFLSGDLRSTYLDGSVAFTRGYRQLVFADILQNGVTDTEIHLMNVTDSPAPVGMLLVDRYGQVLRGPVTRIIPPRGKLGDSVANVFNYLPSLSSAHVWASCTAEALAGFGFIRQPGAVMGLNAQPLEDAGSVLYSPQLAVGHFGVRFNTRLNVVNAGSTATSLNVSLRGNSGELLPGSKVMTPVTLPSGYHFSVDVGSYFGLSGTSPVEGWIKVEGDSGAKLVGDVVFGDGNPAVGELGFGAALPLSAAGQTRFIFSQVAQAKGFYTGLAFLAPVGAELRVEVYNQGGTPVGNAALIMRPGERLVSLLEQLIPSTAGQVGGFVRVTASNPVIGFELFGAADGQFLSAVPPQRLQN
jgi:hypothetical protein